MVTRSEIDVAGVNTRGIYALHEGNGNIDIDVEATDITTTGGNGSSFGIWAHIDDLVADTAGDIVIRVSDVVITTENRGDGIQAQHDAEGQVRIEVENSEITTMTTVTSGGRGVYGWTEGVATGDMVIIVSDSTIETDGRSAHAVFGDHGAENKEGVVSNVVIEVRDSSITTTGNNSYGVRGWRADHEGDVDIDVINTIIITTATTEPNARGIDAYHTGIGDIDVYVEGGSITTGGEHGYGIRTRFQSDEAGEIRVNGQGMTITTTGPTAHGIVANHSGVGDVIIDLRGGSIMTEGEGSYGISSVDRFGVTSTDGNITITTHPGHTITTIGASAHGIVARHAGTESPRTITITIGGEVEASGEGAHGIQIGQLNSDNTDTIPDGTEEQVAEVGADGYRDQTVRVNGRVFGGSGDAAGIFLAGGGKVFIGPQGTVGADSGIAIHAAGDAPKLLVNLNLGGRRVEAVIGDDWILNSSLNDDGETTIVVNGVMLHDGASGNTGNTAPNGAWDVMLREDGLTVDTSTDPWTISERSTGIIADRDFSAEDFDQPQSRRRDPSPQEPDPLPQEQEPDPLTPEDPLFTEVLAPRAALYEVLPDFLQRLTSRECFRDPDTQAQSRLAAGTGRYEPAASTVGASYGFERLGVAGGLNLELGEDVSGRLSLQSADRFCNCLGSYRWRWDRGAGGRPRNRPPLAGCERLLCGWLPLLYRLPARPLLRQTGPA